MIRGIIKTLLVGWVTKKFAQRSARRNGTVAGNSYPDRRV